MSRQQTLGQIFGPAIIAGLVSGVVFVSQASGTGFSLLLFLLAPLPLYYVAARFGPVPVMIAGAVGLAAAALAFPVQGSLQYVFTVAAAPILFAEAGWFQMAQPDGTFRRLGTGAVITSLSFATLLAAIFVVSSLPDSSRSLSDTIRQMLDKGFEAIRAGDMGAIDPGQLAQMEASAVAAARWVPVMAAFFACAQHLGLAKFGQTLATRSNQLGQPPLRLREAKVPLWVFGALAAFMGLAALGGRFGDIGLIAAAGFGFPILVQGFASMHVLTQGWPARRVLLTFIYAVVLFAPQILLPIFVLGIVDQLANLRLKAGVAVEP